MISFCYSSQHWNSQSVLSSKNHRYQHCHVLLLFIPENFQSYRGQPRQTPSQKDVLQHHQPNHRMSLSFCAQNLKTKASNLFECFGRVQLNLNCLQTVLRKLVHGSNRLLRNKFLGNEMTIHYQCNGNTTQLILSSDYGHKMG